jgi:hypothetical protein
MLVNLIEPAPHLYKSSSAYIVVDAGRGKPRRDQVPNELVLRLNQMWVRKKRMPPPHDVSAQRRSDDPDLIDAAAIQVTA